MEKIYVTRTSMPEFEEYIDAIKPLWESHWLTNMGMYHQQLEQELKEYLGVSGISLMVNGHLALELAIQSFGFPKGGEVITTPFTFISTTHAIVRNGLKPVFCDVKADGTIDEAKIETLITKDTVAIVPVHVYGNICDVETIDKIAKRNNLKVIYDAAHAFGIKYKGLGIGSYGDASIFSFHATKVFNTIEGGAVTFNDAEVYERLYNLKNFGIRGEETVVSVGANAKMNEFSAIMGLCNLKNIEAAIESRRIAYECYVEGIRKINKVSIISNDTADNRNYAYLPVLFSGEELRNRVYDLLKEQGVYSRKYFYPLTSDQECYGGQNNNSDISVARSLSSRVLVLPLYEGLQIETVKRILDIINALVVE